MADLLLESIEALYRARFGHFVNVARAIVGDPEAAVDVVQDAFADVIRARATFRSEGPLEAWVWRSVVNRARGHLRHRARSSDPFLVADVAPREVSEIAPLIASLPERQRLVVFLRYYADLDYRTIASVLGVEIGTVSATLFAARTAVRRSLVEVESSG